MCFLHKSENTGAKEEIHEDPRAIGGCVQSATRRAEDFAKATLESEGGKTSNKENYSLDFNS